MPLLTKVARDLIYQYPGRTTDEIARLALDLGCPSRATKVTPQESFASTISQAVHTGRWSDIVRERGEDGVYRLYPVTMRPPIPSRDHPIAAQAEELPSNPYNPEYVINGCPKCSSSVRWVRRYTFYREDPFWVCATCDDAYSDDAVAEVLRRDDIAEALDIITWPIKYTWNGERPREEGLVCPKCGSTQTSLGIVTEAIRSPTRAAPRQIFMWKCHECAEIFDMLDVPQYWSIARQVQNQRAWEEEFRLMELYGTDEYEWPLFDAAS